MGFETGTILKAFLPCQMEQVFLTHHVSVADSGHGDQGPPVGVEHGVELRVCDAVLLKDEGQGGEDQDPDGEKKNE